MADASPFRLERLLALFGVCVVVAIVVSAGTTSAAFSPFNNNWEGASGLQTVAADAGVESDIALTTAVYDSAQSRGTVAVVVSPDGQYTDTEAAAVGRFVRGGGTLVVAEDFGSHSNHLLASLGAQSRIDGQLVVDEAIYYHSPTMPVAQPDAQSGLLVGVDTFTLNHGSYLQPNGAQVLIESSELATVGNDAGNPTGTSVGPYPLVTVEPLGDGTVIVVSDSSALINAMLTRPGNAAFVHNVFVRHDRVILDYSHSDHVPPLEQALVVLASVPLLQVGLGVGAVLLVGLLATRLGRVRGYHPGAVSHRAGGTGTTADPMSRDDRPSNTGGDHATLAAHLRTQYPEWDRDRTERIARATHELSGTSTLRDREP